MASSAVEDHGYITNNLNICLITFSMIFIVLRCYVRRFMLDSTGWDDCFAVIACVSTSKVFVVIRSVINLFC
jgi:hypothetical protein